MSVPVQTPAEQFIDFLTLSKGVPDKTELPLVDGEVSLRLEVIERNIQRLNDTFEDIPLNAHREHTLLLLSLIHI